MPKDPKTAKPAKAGKKKNGRPAGNVVRGPALREKVRVPIDPVAKQKKETEHARLAIQVRQIERKIKPDKIKIAELKDQMKDLETDIEDEMEEREMLVEREYDYATKEVRFFDAATGDEVGEPRTMTPEEVKRTGDIEDKPGGIMGGKKGKAHVLPNPVLTPGQAMAAARKEDQAPDAGEDSAEG